MEKLKNRVYIFLNSLIIVGLIFIILTCTAWCKYSFFYEICDIQSLYFFFIPMPLMIAIRLGFSALMELEYKIPKDIVKLPMKIYLSMIIPTVFYNPIIASIYGIISVIILKRTIDKFKNYKVFST